MSGIWAGKNQGGAAVSLIWNIWFVCIYGCEVRRRRMEWMAGVQHAGLWQQRPGFASWVPCVVGFRQQVRVGATPPTAGRETDHISALQCFTSLFELSNHGNREASLLNHDNRQVSVLKIKSWKCSLLLQCIIFNNQTNSLHLDHFKNGPLARV